MAIHDSTKDMLDMLPRWMEMQNEESYGAKYLDVIGRQLDDFENLVESVLMSAIITPGERNSDPEKVNILEVDYLYKFRPHQAVTDTNSMSLKVMKDGLEYILRRSNTIYDFYLAGSDKFYLDIDKGTFYFKVDYDLVSINGAAYEYSPLEFHHVWNPLDEIGLLFGCPRLVDDRESNNTYRERLLGVFRNPGGSSNTGLINYISRSLGLEKDQVVVNSLDEDSFVHSLVNKDGSIKQELREYMSVSKSVNGFGMNTYWETLDENELGLKYLPMVWDLGLDKWENSKIQNGIGDTDDLEIIAPKQESFEQYFKYNLYAEGLLYPDRKIYPEHRFKYKVYATGKKYDNGYSPEAYKYTITASDLILLTFDIMANKKYYHEYRLDYKRVNLYPKVSQIQTPTTDIVANVDMYITSDIKLTNGSYCTNTPRRYLQVLATMQSDHKRLLTPTVRNITVNYKVDGVDKTLRIETEESVERINDNTHIAGFEVNTWNDASPVIRVKNDTNDTYNMIAHENGDLTLGQGDYQRMYNSEGDWDDGMSNPETINVTVTNRSLKLGNMRIS